MVEIVPAFATENPSAIELELQGSRFHNDGNGLLNQCTLQGCGAIRLDLGALDVLENFHLWGVSAGVLASRVRVLRLRCDPIVDYVAEGGLDLTAAASLVSVVGDGRTID